MSRLSNILPVLLVLLAATGCHSHRVTVSHEDACLQRAILDSTAVRADTLRRAESAAVQWLERAVLLEWDSVDYRIVTDSAGRALGITGSRRSSRRSGKSTASRAASSQAVSQAMLSTSTVLSDSVKQSLSQEKTVETKADVSGALHWLELVLMAILLMLAVGGVIHLRELTERWSKRR